MSSVAGFTSTGSKRPDLLFGSFDDVPARMTHAAGYTVHTADGRQYVDLIMALGAVALGYGHPAVDAAAIDAVRRGAVGPLSPEDEAALATEICGMIPWIEQVRFLKTGAEAMAAAVRLARVATGRDLVLGCGYHGWLDWCSAAAGVPDTVRHLYGEVPFNDPEVTLQRIRREAGRLACVVIEPVIETHPDPEWLAVLRRETEQVGALLIFDEIKTAFRVGAQGAAGRYGTTPDLMVMGKALANGFPLAAVAGRRDIMRRVADTWISSTLATEFVSLAAARATLRVMRAQRVPDHLRAIGTELLDGLRAIAARHDGRFGAASGIAEMCYIRWRDDATGERIARGCARRGLLFKRAAYNFVSLAHDHEAIVRVLGLLGETVDEVAASPSGG